MDRIINTWVAGVQYIAPHFLEGGGPPPMPVWLVAGALALLAIGAVVWSGAADTFGEICGWVLGIGCAMFMAVMLSPVLYVAATVALLVTGAAAPFYYLRRMRDQVQERRRLREQRLRDVDRWLEHG